MKIIQYSLKMERKENLVDKKIEFEKRKILSYLINSIHMKRMG